MRGFRVNLKSAEVIGKGDTVKQTGISDNKLYPMYCYFASKDDSEFARFKQDPVYNAILEHVSPQQGADYLQKIFGDDELHLSAKDWKYILRNDSIGNPRVVKYNFGDSQIVCSPTTLRYVKVLSDISKLFPKSILRGGIRDWHRIRRAMQNFNARVAD